MNPYTKFFDFPGLINTQLSVGCLILPQALKTVFNGFQTLGLSCVAERGDELKLLVERYRLKWRDDKTVENG